MNADDDPEVEQEASADNGSTVIQSGRDTLIAGRDLHHNSATVAGAIGIGGAAVGSAVGTGIGAVAANSATAGTTTATGLGGVVTTKMIVAGALVAATTAGVGGYAAYQHYTCDSFFGTRTAKDVIDTAREKFTDARFSFDFRTGSGFTMDGYIDNARPAASLHSRIADITTDIVYLDNAAYFRLADEPWTKVDVEAWQDPQVSQGNPVKTVEYLASSGDATQSNCELQGTFDSRMLLPTRPETTIPFHAKVDPSGRLVHLTVVLPDQDTADWDIHDYGTTVEVTAPI
ncbi:hypothetical protein [Saccharothrix variisporea]|uniref:Uncharacterized protein n=1 Tax=Saccharothrix variisporea TaxID=543527 RepID=A0A495X107_9PSEU|nr:hypothetical protein [Saccharothrix variisporea]RKT67831.1 hypothetical protein DFJ66_1007 [Saccharothrix variisporea]